MVLLLMKNITLFSKIQAVSAHESEQVSSSQLLLQSLFWAKREIKTNQIHVPPNQTFTDSDYKKEVIKAVLSQVVIFKMERLTRGDPGVAPVNPTLVRYRRHGLANTADPNQQ